MKKILNIIKNKIKVISIVAILVITISFITYKFNDESKIAQELIYKKYSQQNPRFAMTFKKTSIIKLNQKNLINNIFYPKYTYIIEDFNGIIGGYSARYERNIPMLDLKLNENSISTFQVKDNTKKFEELLNLIKEDNFIQQYPNIFELEKSENE
ncbi:MAG: hypothetical protein ACRCXZ_01190, partial [Patescibacteria group bacterium]